MTDSKREPGHASTNNRNFVERITSIITRLTDSIMYAYIYSSCITSMVRTSPICVL